MKKTIIIVTSLLILAGIGGFALENYNANKYLASDTVESVAATEAGDESLPARSEGTVVDGEEVVPPEGAAPAGQGEAGEKPVIDTAAIAEKLGVTEDELIAAFGEPTAGELPDFAAAAETLGVTEAELQSAME
ncbi:MAG: hypothetical protein JJE03_02635 [Peptostreptococcaceae bacterium]|nr:hypothetical protein [Peptostreptococcaceae bacterium]